MKLRSSFCFLSLAIVAFALSAVPARAQGIPTSASGLDLSASTNNPLPGQEITVTARSYSTNINAAKMVWTANGSVISSGVGITSVTIKAPALGKTLTVTVDAVTSDGTGYEGTINIGSGSVDMIEEPDGYVPPQFQGKISAAFQNSVKITAIPHLANASGVEYSPSSLVYRWQQGTTVLEDQSGYGRNSIVVQGGLIPRPFNVSVTVSSRDGSAQTSGITGVTMSSPSLLFYQNDPLYGVLFNKAIVQFLPLGSSGETQAYAVPFGFSTGNGVLSLDWVINGREHPELAKNKTVTLRAPAESTSGTSDVSLYIHNTKQILQEAQGGFTVGWNRTANTSQIKFQ